MSRASVRPGFRSCFSPRFSRAEKTRAALTVVLPTCVVVLLGSLCLALIAIGQYSAGIALSCVLSAVAALSIAYYFGEVSLPELVEQPLPQDPLPRAALQPGSPPRVGLVDGDRAVSSASPEEITLSFPPGDALGAKEPPVPPLALPATAERLAVPSGAAAPAPAPAAASTTATSTEPPSATASGAPAAPAANADKSVSQAKPDASTDAAPIVKALPPAGLDAVAADEEKGDVEERSQRAQELRYVIRKTIATVFVGVVFLFNVVAIIMFFAYNRVGEGIGVLSAVIAEMVIVVTFFYLSGRNDDRILDLIADERQRAALRENKLRREAIRELEFAARDMHLLRRENALLREDVNDNTVTRDHHIRRSSLVLAQEAEIEDLRRRNMLLTKELAAAGEIVRQQRNLLDAHAVDREIAASHGVTNRNSIGTERTPVVQSVRRFGRQRATSRSRVSPHARSSRARIVPITLTPSSSPAVVPVDLEGGYAARYERRLSRKEVTRLSYKDFE